MGNGCIHEWGILAQLLFSSDQPGCEMSFRINERMVLGALWGRARPGAGLGRQSKAAVERHGGSGSMALMKVQDASEHDPNIEAKASPCVGMHGVDPS